MIELSNGRARVGIDPVNGGRLASLRIDGRELLVAGDAHSPPMSWGSFPMVPYAGRVRRGHLEFAGAVHELPVTLGPHAIHGMGYLQRWTVEPSADGSVRLSCDLDATWPFGGRAEQVIRLDPDGLDCRLSVTAGDLAMPAQVGWHPWFVKPDRLVFVATSMYLRDADGMPTGELVEVPEGPWDDCFAGVSEPPRLAWGDLELVLTSDCDEWVVYDQLEHATCVEPQSGPPDGFTLAPHVLAPGQGLARWMRMSWSQP